MRKINCSICGCVVETKSNNRKYCDGCKKLVEYEPPVKKREYHLNYYKNHQDRIKRQVADRRTMKPATVRDELKRYRRRLKLGISAKYNTGDRRSYVVNDNVHKNILARFGLTLDDVKKIANS